MTISPSVVVMRASSLIKFEGGFISTRSAGTILMLMTPTRLSGALFSPDGLGPTGVSAIFSSTSSPLISLPNAVY